MTARLRYVGLVVRAWCELARFDLLRALSTGSTLRLPLVAPWGRKATDTERTSTVCDAVATATCLYWSGPVCPSRMRCSRTSGWTRHPGVAGTCGR